MAAAVTFLIYVTIRRIYIISFNLMIKSKGDSLFYCQETEPSAIIMKIKRPLR